MRSEHLHYSIKRIEETLGRQSHSRPKHQRVKTK